jgi:hypothetical protein
MSVERTRETEANTKEIGKSSSEIIGRKYREDKRQKAYERLDVENFIINRGGAVDGKLQRSLLSLLCLGKKNDRK